MKVAKTGDWVQITRTIMKAGERAPQVPEDTQNCDLRMWVKGYALNGGSLGDEIEIVTTTGRTEKGLLSEIAPGYTHTYGNFVPELNLIQKQLRSLLFGGEENE